MVFIFSQVIKNKEEYVAEITHDLQSLKYLLSGPVQNKCPNPWPWGIDI